MQSMLRVANSLPAPSALRLTTGTLVAGRRQRAGSAASAVASSISRPAVRAAHQNFIDRAEETASEAQPSSAELGPLIAERSTQALEAGLHIVPTPIGNLEDITLRAIRVLQQSTTVLAEDTRHTRKLLVHYGLRTQLLSLHEHNEHSRITQVLEQLAMGSSLALVSDAGMPSISDPGSRIISAAIAGGHRIIPLPGASAAITALVASGLPADDFRFLGFLPPKSGARQRRLQELAGEEATLIFYAPPHGLASILRDAADVLGGERACVIARELTKVNEEFHRGSLAAAAQHYDSAPVKGEITLMIGGAQQSSSQPPNEGQLQAVLQRLLQAGESASSAAKLAAAECGVSKRTVYNLAVQLAAEQHLQREE